MTAGVVIVTWQAGIIAASVLGVILVGAVVVWWRVRK